MGTQENGWHDVMINVEMVVHISHDTIATAIGIKTDFDYFLNYLCSCLTEARAHALVPQ